MEMLVFTKFCCYSFSPSRHGKSKELTPGMSLEVTVGDLTVVITDYEPKSSNHKRSSTDSQDSSSFHSNHTDTGSPPLCTNRVPDWGALSDTTAGYLYSAHGRIGWANEGCTEGEMCCFV